MNTIFQLANTLALLAWLAIAIFPKNKYTLLTAKYGIITVLSLCYAFLVVPGLANFDPNSFSTLQQVKNLFSQEEVLTAGWIHYLAFDLFVGIYIIEEGISKGLARWKYSLCLPCTFMFGPLGLLMFYLFKLGNK